MLLQQDTFVGLRATDFNNKNRIHLYSHLKQNKALDPGSLFTKRQDFLPTNLVKSRSREMVALDDNRIALKFDRHLAS